MKLIFAALAVVAGIAVAFQGATNQGLLKSAGIGPALVVNTVVVLIGATGLWLATMALGFLVLQAFLGLLLQNPATKPRKALRRVHYGCMTLIIFLIALHVWLNA